MAEREEIARCLKRHKDGSFYVRKYLGTNPVTGKKDEKQRELKTKDARTAIRLAGEFLDNLNENPLVPVALERYIDFKERLNAPANTVSSYRTRVRWFAPYFARIRVRDLTTANVNDAYMELMDSGTEHGRPLSGTSVRAAHAFLRAAYNWFIACGLADENPTINATLPPKDTMEAQALDKDSVAKLMAMIDEAMQDGPDGCNPVLRNVAFAAKLAYYTGLRVGELCGLRRRDVSASQMHIHVWGTAVKRHGVRFQAKTKGKRSRNVGLSERDLMMIGEHTAWQDTLFKGGPSTPLVSADGKMMSPDKVSRVFSRMARAAGLPADTHFHTLRHTHATWLLTKGGDYNTVSERLGHADPRTTLSIYGHVKKGRDHELAELLHDVTEAILDGS